MVYELSMLSRYQMKRGSRAEELPAGIRQDIRKHTKHVLRPEADLVAEFLTSPSEVAWEKLARSYRSTVKERFAQGRGPFDELADLAGREDVLLGCSCPTKKNSDVKHCHTWLALEFMAEQYPDLDIRFP